MEKAGAVAGVRAPHIHAWPPVVEGRGAEPSLAAILLIFVAGTWATHALGDLVPREGPPTDAAVRLVVVGALRLATWLAVVAALAWGRPAGLGRGMGSSWGVVPLVVVSLAVALSGWPRDVPNGVSFVLAVSASDVLGALREEVVFRGFLFHGLARRVGGAGAVMLSSLLFAIAHVPRYVREERPSGEIVAVMIVVFCLGLFLCRVRAATGSIWMPAAIHAMWNLAVGAGSVAFPTTPGPITYAYTAPFALGAVLFLSLTLPRLWPRTFGALGAFEILGERRAPTR